MFTRKPEKWAKQILASTKGSNWELMGEFVGSIEKASNNQMDFKDPKVWIICGPAHIHPILLKQIAQAVTPDSFVGTLFAQGGFNWACEEVFGSRLKKENITVFGLFNIPWIVKATEYGKSVRIIGPKSKLFVTCEPVSKKR